MKMRVVTLADAYGPGAGHLEGTIALVGLGIAAVLFVVFILFLVIRRGRPGLLLGGSVVALLGTVLVLALV